MHPGPYNPSPQTQYAGVVVPRAIDIKLASTVPGHGMMFHLSGQ